MNNIQISLDFSKVEVWKDVPEWVGLYQASSKGQVRSIARRGTAGKILAPGKDPGGYLRCVFCRNGKNHTKKVHRVIANTFIKNPDKLETVDHINFNKLDNRIENLRWLSHYDNIMDHHKNGSQYYPFGTDHFAAKLNPESVLKMRQLRLTGLSFQKIADKFGVHKKTAISAINGITWSHVK